MSKNILENSWVRATVYVALFYLLASAVVIGVGFRAYSFGFILSLMGLFISFAWLSAIYVNEQQEKKGAFAKEKAAGSIQQETK